MPERRRSRTVLAVLTLAALVLVTLDFRQGDQGLVADLQRGALVVFGPVQEGFAEVVRPIGGFFAAIGELNELRARNAELEQELAELRERLPSVANLERENDEFRKLFAMRQDVGLTTTAARVIGQPPGAADNTVLIDAGAENGLEPGMAVLTADGLVGKLTEVVQRHARVELLTSPNAHYAVRVAETTQTGRLRGQGALPFQLEILDPEATVPEGAEVVTQLFQGTTIPDGIPIGEVVEPPEGAEVNVRYLSVRPYVNFTKLSIVQVVLDEPLQPVELEAEDLVSDPDATRPDPPSGEEPSERAPEPTAKPTSEAASEATEPREGSGEEPDGDASA